MLRYNRAKTPIFVEPSAFPSGNEKPLRGTISNANMFAPHDSKLKVPGSMIEAPGSKLQAQADEVVAAIIRIIIPIIIS